MMDVPSKRVRPKIGPVPTGLLGFSEAERRNIQWEWAMTQNIYDNESFFAVYSRLPRSVEGLDGAPEWPTLRAMLPEVSGRRAVDLGCGSGWFCRWARQD